MTDRRSGYIIGLLAVGIAACDGGSGTPSDLTPDVPVTVTTTTITVAGRATKGPLADAQIEIFQASSDGRTEGPAVASTTTDAQGNWSATVPANHQGLLVRSTGGNFVDESDPDPDLPRTITLTDNDTLLSYLPPGQGMAAITLVSDALVRKARLETNNNNFATRLQSNRDRYSSVLGLDPLATAAADPLSPAGNDEERRYALIAGGLAYALNALAVQRGQAVADYATIDLLLDDLIDCRLDGLGLGGHVLYDISLLNGRTLNDEILRFRNNRIDDYADLDLPVLDTSGCQPSPGSDDSEPPVFVSVAPPLTVAADDATGTRANSPQITAALAAFGADDNRADSARIDLVAAERLPLGVNTVRVTATDGWGNVTSTNWTVTVADLTPPIIAAPADVRVDAAAVLTQVELGVATANDNVSALLSLSNNAPADGFPVGDTEVVWRAVDEAGLVAEAVQIVTVVGTTPELTTPVAVLPGAVGSAINVDLSSFFSDPFGAALTYVIAGLPQGSGLQLDPLTGQLSGVATAADQAASPLMLTVTASNGQFSLDADFSLAIAPREPVFSLSTAALSLVEDFESAPTIVATQDVATPAGVVNYSASIDNPIATVSISAQGELRVAAIADAYGTARIDVLATNVLNGQSVVRSVVLEVDAVNDAPLALLATEELVLATDEAVSLDLNARFFDVDDAELTVTASGFPGSLVLNDEGRVEGTPETYEANVPAYPVEVVATDPAGESASARMVLRIEVADRDGDGLSDARELEIGTDPDAVDSDGDGVDDWTEIAAGADPVLPAANVIYVSPDGDNNQSGASFAEALRDNDGLMMVPPGQSAAQPTFVIYAASDTIYGGSVWIMPPCDHIVFAGSVDVTSGRLALSDNQTPASRFTALEAPSFEIDGCTGVALQNLTIANNTRHAIHSELSTLSLDNVQLVNNRAEVQGGALHLAGSDALLSNVLVSANRSELDGGGVALTGASSSLIVRNSVLGANSATNRGGAIFVEAPGAIVTLDNVLLTHNSASRGGAVQAASVADLSVAHSTWAFNRSLTGNDGAALSLADGLGASVRDSVLFGNTDAGLAISAFDPGVVSNFNSSDAAAVGPADRMIDADARVFGEKYFVTDEALAIDGGSGQAAAAGLDQRFSAAGSVLPDLGIADRGYHYFARPQSPFDAQTLSATVQRFETATPRFDDYRALDFLPRVDGRNLGSGHRVMVRPLNGRSDLIGALRSVGPENRVPAVDLGNGYYRVYRRDNAIAATQFELTVDDVIAERTIAFDCALGGCDGLPVTPPAP